MNIIKLSNEKKLNNKKKYIDLSDQNKITFDNTKLNNIRKNIKNMRIKNTSKKNESNKKNKLNKKNELNKKNISNKKNKFNNNRDETITQNIAKYLNEIDYITYKEELHAIYQIINNLPDKENIKAILDSYLVDNNVENIDNFIFENNNKKCFIIGNGPNLKDIDLSLLRNHVTIACNSFYLGLYENNIKFVPTILCAGDIYATHNILTNYFNLIYDENENYRPIIILHPTYITKIKNKNVLQQIENNIAKYEDIYNIQNFSKFILSKKSISLNNINNNLNKYCKIYRNVIPMISLLIAEKLGFKNIYIIGFDCKNVFNHFYNINTAVGYKYLPQNYKNIYNGFKIRYEELKAKNINVYINNKESLVDFIPYFDLDDVLNE